MPVPIFERIIDDVLTTLQGVTTAAGYNHTLQVERPLSGIGNRLRDNLCVVMTGDATRRDDARDNWHEHWDTTFNVHCYAIEPEASLISIETRLMRQWADVYRALCGSLALRQRSQLAHDTIPQGTSLLIESPDSHDGEIICAFSVWWHHLKGDMTSL